MVIFELSTISSGCLMNASCCSTTMKTMMMSIALILLIDIILSCSTWTRRCCMLVSISVSQRIAQSCEMVV